MKSVIAAFVMLLTATSSVFGCICERSKNIKEEVAAHSLIFKGIPISLDTLATFLSINDNDTFYFAKIRFKFVISAYLKGKINSDTVTIVTGLGGGDCGFPFKIGQVYIVFAREQEVEEFDFSLLKQYKGRPIPDLKALKSQYYHTSTCTWTCPFTKEVEIFLNKELIGSENGS